MHFKNNLSCLLETPTTALPPECRQSAEMPGSGRGLVGRGGGCRALSRCRCRSRLRPRSAQQRALMPLTWRRAPAVFAHTCVCTRFTHLFPAKQLGFVLFNGVQQWRELPPVCPGLGGRARADWDLVRDLSGHPHPPAGKGFTIPPTWQLSPKK